MGRTVSERLAGLSGQAQGDSRDLHKQAKAGLELEEGEVRLRVGWAGTGSGSEALAVKIWESAHKTWAGAVWGRWEGPADSVSSWFRERLHLRD